MLLWAWYHCSRPDGLLEWHVSVLQGQQLHYVQGRLLLRFQRTVRFCMASLYRWLSQQKTAHTQGLWMN